MATNFLLLLPRNPSGARPQIAFWCLTLPVWLYVPALMLPAQDQLAVKTIFPFSSKLSNLIYFECHSLYCSEGFFFLALSRLLELSKLFLKSLFVYQCAALRLQLHSNPPGGCRRNYQYMLHFGVFWPHPFNGDSHRMNALLILFLFARHRFVLCNVNSYSDL